jgi:hypothetical protein
MVIVIGIAFLPARLQAAEATAEVLDGVHWVGSPVTLEGLRGKTVVLIDYATWCPICNKWSGDFITQVKEAIHDKPVVVLAINNDSTPGNVKPYLAAREFFAPNIIHGYDAGIAKRNGIPDLWGYMIIDPAGQITEKGQAGSFFGGDANKVFVLPKNLQSHSNLGEFSLIDVKMPDDAKNILWPVELGIGSAADLHKLSGGVKQEVEAALAKYGEKELEKIHKLAEGDLSSQFAADDLANALSVQLKGSAAAKEAKKTALSLESNAKFRRELAAKKAFERWEQMPSDSPGRSKALTALVKRFDGTVYGGKAKEAVAANVPVKAGK